MKDISRIIGPHEQGIHILPHQSRELYDAYERLNPSSVVKGLIDDEIDPYAVKLEFERPHSNGNDAMACGTLAHMAILEPETINASVAVWSGGDRRGNEWKDFEDHHAGKLIIRQADFAKTMLGVSQAASHPRIRELLRATTTETTLLWHEGPVACKGRVDAVGKELAKGCNTINLVDVKTTSRGISPMDCERTTKDMKYREKMAMYRRPIAAKWGIPPCDVRCYLIYLRLDPPYGFNIQQLGSDGLDYHEDRMMLVIDAVRQRIEAGEFKPVELETVFGLTSWEARSMQLESLMEQAGEM